MRRADWPSFSHPGEGRTSSFFAPPFPAFLCFVGPLNLRVTFSWRLSLSPCLSLSALFHCNSFSYRPIFLNSPLSYGTNSRGRLHFCGARSNPEEFFDPLIERVPFFLSTRYPVTNAPGPFFLSPCFSLFLHSCNSILAFFPPAGTGKLLTPWVPTSFFFLSHFFSGEPFLSCQYLSFFVPRPLACEAVSSMV